MKVIDARHRQLVTELSAEVKKAFEKKRQVKIFHGSTNSTRPQHFTATHSVDISSLNKILEVNENEQYVIVEPNVSMERLVEGTLKRGLIPPVVMEFPGITVGGGIQGGAGESGSFRWGLFDQTALEYEMILGDGKIITVSDKENEDLFRATACSYGSLGILTAIKLRLVPAKKYVKLNYLPTGDISSTINLVHRKVVEQPDYLDAIQLSPNSGVVMAGCLSNEDELPHPRFRRAWQEWFYLHVKEMRERSESFEEAIPIRDYLFRYDRGGFWVGDYGFGILHLPNVWLTRLLFNWFFTTRTLYRFMHATNASQQYLVQDVCLPAESVEEFAKFNDQTAAVYPLWLCPVRPGGNDLSPSNLIAKLVINVGIWGKYLVANDKFIAMNREIEKIVASLGGKKVLYAHSYYPEDEFWRIYDKKRYESLRQKYSADQTFVSIYPNVIVKERIQSSRFRGILGLFFSPYRIQRTKNKP